MSQLGFVELVVIGLIALVVLGPERLPTAARTVGALLRRLRSSWAGVRSEIERELAADEIKQRLAQARHDLDLSRHVDSVSDEIDAVAKEIKDVAKLSPQSASSDSAGTDVARPQEDDDGRT